MPSARHVLPYLVLFLLAKLAAAADLVTVSPVGRKAMAPEIAVGADGAVNLIWIERTSQGEALAAAGAASKEGHTHLAETDLWYARATDGGRTFSAPVRVNTGIGAVWGFPVSKPRVLVSRDGTVHVFYPGNSVVAKTGKPIVLPMYTRSTDQGRTFAPARVLGAVPASDNSEVVSGGLANAECFGTLAIDDAGGVYAYWIDTRDMGPQSKNGKIFSAVSLDNGATFSRDFEVLPADACPCCQITATTQGGKIYMGSRQVSPEGQRDSVIAVSADRGRSFQPRVRWGGARWTIEGCPLKANAIAVDGANVYTAAFNGGAAAQGAWFSRSTDGGRSFDAAIPLHAAAAVSDAPVLAIVDGALVAAWHAKTGDERRIWMSVSRDRGASFSAPLEIPAPAGTGIYPVVAAHGGGVHVAWQQADAIVTRHVALTELAPVAAAARAVTPEAFGHELAALRGQVVMLNVWATWCSPCLREISDLLAVEAELAPRGFALLGLSVDDAAETPRVDELRRKNFPGFRTLVRDAPDMDAAVSVVDRAWNEVVPTTYFIGRDGRVLARIQGKKSREEFHAAALAALAAPDAP